MFDILGILYAVAQLLVPSLPPAPLSSTALLSNDKYLGQWYFIGVASLDAEDIEVYQGIDNCVTDLKKSADDSLVMTAAIHQGGQCQKMSWTYKVDPSIDPLMEEADNLGLMFDGKWIKCDSCLLVLKIHPDDAFIRMMLFARNQDSRAELVKKFKSKMESYWIFEHFMIPPQTKEFCKLEELP
ncbi:apolipoprotein M [Salminus brasiliensis]|uniref:apolipoprotein M n=1 Tax=Salminus brasiliensis TaxID=930266 RepID=UPI003B838BF5